MTIYIKQNIVPLINAPARKGKLLGNIEMYIDEERIYNEDVVLDINIPKNNIFFYIKYGLNNIFNIKLDLW